MRAADCSADGGIHRYRTAEFKVNQKRLAILVEERTRELRETESRFRILFADNPLPLWLYDQPTLHFLEVNQAAILRYGYSRDDFLSMKITDIQPEMDIPRLLDAVQNPGRENHAVWKHRLKSGDLVDVEVTSRRVDWNGRGAVLVAAVDVTERKATEQALRQAKESAEAANLSHFF